MDDERLTFEEARARLRARGYLDRGVEGAVLKGALAARSRAASLVRGAAVAALLLASGLAVAATVLIGVRSALPLGDIALLFAYLLAAALVAAAVLVGVLVGVAELRVRGRGDAEAVSTELGAAFGLLAGVAAVLAARPALAAAGAAAAAAVLLAVAAAVFLAVRVARGVAFTVLFTTGRSVLSGRRAGPGALVLALLVVLAAALASRSPSAPPAEPLVVTSNGHRVVLVGVDGWSDRYLPAGAAPLPGTAHRYEREGSDPAAFWTTVATGEGPARHGVGALDLVGLAGMTRPVRPLPGTGWYLGGLLQRWGLAHREPATAAARRVPAAWEVAARGGVPALVVNWWTTWPAGASGATVLSNHLFFAARAGAPLTGEGWPPEAASRAAALVPRGAPAPGPLERLIADAEGLDAFAIAAFRDARVARAPRLACVYLPGPDILASALADPGRPAADRVALASALQAEAARVAAFLTGADLRDATDLVAVVLDAGRAEREGVVRMSGPLASGAEGPLEPADLAPTLLAALGVPASREAAGRVRPGLLAPGAATGATVASWGRPAPAAGAPVDPRAYVENLRSLGYLK